uniref:FAM13A-like domain-containing protein n=1 Tax=Anopheles marajoara TaxID=58244 RepID=A0A2M4BC77_9DIPT
MLCVQANDRRGDGTSELIHKLAHACKIRQWKSKCGMRRPSLGQNEDDLSRLTTILSPTSISLSSNGQSDPVVVVVAAAANDPHDVSCSKKQTGNINHNNNSVCNSNSSSSSSSSSSSTNSSISNSSNNTGNKSSSSNGGGLFSVGGGGGGGGSCGSINRSSSGGSNSSNTSNTSCEGRRNEVVRKSRDDGGVGAGGDGGGFKTPEPSPPTPAQPPASSVLVNQYLPNLINSSEWQNCRKRKERQDSTSSISQDRKLIRSNSEEHLPNCAEVIRRVSSHEDFKKRAPTVEISIDKENIIAEEEAAEADGLVEQQLQGAGDELQLQQVFEKNLKNSADDLKKFFIGSVESVANGGGTGKDHHLQLHHGKVQQQQQQQHRLSPCRDILKSRRDSDSDQDCEHERRRHCERFSKTRPPPGRKSVSPRARSKQSSKFHGASLIKDRAGNGAVLSAGSEHFYSKHDTHSSSVSKSDRRSGAVRGSKSSDQRAVAAALLLQQAIKDHSLQTGAAHANSGYDIPMIEATLSDYNDNNVLEKNKAIEQEERAALQQQQQQEQHDTMESYEEPLSPREKLPWGPQSYPDDTPALVCQRFADDKFDHAKRMDSVSHAKLRPVSSGGSLKQYGSYHRSEDSVGMGGVAAHPKSGAAPVANNMFDERIKTISRKLSGLKKKLTQFEERFEREHGCRPTHGDKSADPNIKSIVVEMHKLRKEKNQIKADLVVFSAKGLTKQTTNTTDNAGPDTESDEKMRLCKMKDTIADIEKRLTEKRETDHRSENLDMMSSEQLTEEKASVQRALLYLESMYGRPASREERDAARPLYDRYRLIKRLVNRANSISGPCGVANSQMPTILEHEALALVGTSTPSTDITPPSATSMIQSPSDTGGQSATTATTATTTTTTTDDSEGSTATTTTTVSSATENIHSMTADELWQHYDATREEKKELRRTIKEFEQQFEETTGRKMLKSDRKSIEDTYALYKQKKAKLRLIDALFKKQMQG